MLDSFEHVSLDLPLLLLFFRSFGRNWRFSLVSYYLTPHSTCKLPYESTSSIYRRWLFSLHLTATSSTSDSMDTGVSPFTTPRTLVSLLVPSRSPSTTQSSLTFTKQRTHLSSKKPRHQSGWSTISNTTSPRYPSSHSSSARNSRRSTLVSSKLRCNMVWGKITGSVIILPCRMKRADSHFSLSHSSLAPALRDPLS